MKTSRFALCAASGILVAALALPAASQMPRSVDIGPVEKIQQITAGPDGTAWGLTGSGRLFFCKTVNMPQIHIACYDERGPVKANFDHP